jgi:hypothetical protein
LASAWIERRASKDGVRFRVKYRLGGRESVPRYAGAFATRREALLRRSWVAGELAAMRVPDLTLLTAPAAAETLQEAAARWKASRVDIAENTRLQHRLAVNAVLPHLGDRPVDEITPADIAELVGALTAKGR